MRAILLSTISILFCISCATSLRIYNGSDRIIAKVDKNGNYNFSGKEKHEKAMPGNYLFIRKNSKTVELELKINDFDEKIRMEETYNKLIQNLSSGLRITVINITAPMAVMGDFLVDELTSLLVNTNKYIIVDRRSLDVVRYEQYFQMSGNVDDNTAVSIGKLLGADVIIIGVRDDNGLFLKAIDVKTARILTTALT
jgi:hypothetical protein